MSLITTAIEWDMHGKSFKTFNLDTWELFNYQQPLQLQLLLPPLPESDNVNDLLLHMCREQRTSGISIDRTGRWNRLKKIPREWLKMKGARKVCGGCGPWWKDVEGNWTTHQLHHFWHVTSHSCCSHCLQWWSSSAEGRGHKGIINILGKIPCLGRIKWS